MCSLRHLLAMVSLLVALAVPATAAPGPTFVDPPRPLGNYTFTDHTGAPLSTAELRTRATVLFFGYTHCPDVCPLTLARLAAARRALPPAQREALRIVLVTVDPMRDTPERLAEFLAPFGPDVTGLTAPLGTLAPLLRELGVSYAYTVQETAGHAEHADHAGHALPAYTVTHSEALYLLDAQARLYAVWTQPGDGAALTRVLADLARGVRPDGVTPARPAAAR